MKHWYQSRTVWIAVIQGVIAGMIALTTVYPELQAVSFVILAKSILDIALRSITSTSIE